jgi:hypothetical protein
MAAYRRGIWACYTKAGLPDRLSRLALEPRHTHDRETVEASLRLEWGRSEILNDGTVDPRFLRAGSVFLATEWRASEMLQSSDAYRQRNEYMEAVRAEVAELPRVERQARYLRLLHKRPRPPRPKPDGMIIYRTELTGGDCFDTPLPAGESGVGGVRCPPENARRKGSPGC